MAAGNDAALRWSGGTLLADGQPIGELRVEGEDSSAHRDEWTELAPGTYRWRRIYGEPAAEPPAERSIPRVTLTFRTAFKTDYHLIPGVSYDGNRWGSGREPKGFVHGGEPWRFAYHRTAVAGGTFSRGAEWSVGLFGRYGGVGFACSLLPEETGTSHRLHWPGDERPLSYVHRDRYAEPLPDEAFGRPEPEPEPEREPWAGPGSGPDPKAAPEVAPEAAERKSDGESDGKPVSEAETTLRALTAYLVVSRTDSEQPAWRHLLAAAWELNRRPARPRQSAAELWTLGVRYAKESLWTERDGFGGFAIGLRWTDGGWSPHPHYEVGWCGQNASLANSLLADYLLNRDEDSLAKGLRTLDAWTSLARLPRGLIRCHLDRLLGIDRGEAPEALDACNLGTAAVQFLEAHELAGRCGLDRPAYRDAALGICGFALDEMEPSGRIGKAWTTDGDCLDRDGSVGAFFATALAAAYRASGDSRYLAGAKAGYRFYLGELKRNGYATSGALDTHCIDKEGAMPLLEAGLTLFELTGEREFLEGAVYASWYLATWQWHHTVRYPEGSVLRELGYDTFGGTSVSTQHHHLDAYAVKIVPAWLQLSRLTGDPTWAERARAVWANASCGISDGTLAVRGRTRPPGAQDEAFHHTYWGEPAIFGVSEWLVAWPTAFRLEALRHCFGLKKEITRAAAKKL